jgi:Mn2+/Fe2+ NRAMP family transporter
VLWGACALLVIANVINIAADLGGMAAATKLVTGVPVALMVPVFGLVIVLLLMWSSYRTIARVFKWLTLMLLAYVLTAFVAHVDWRLALRATIIAHVEWSRAFFSVLVAILGTTISPYLFFCRRRKKWRKSGRWVATWRTVVARHAKSSTPVARTSPPACSRRTPSCIS